MGVRIPDNVEERIALPMTADAAQAYADYVALGRERSLQRLADQYAARTKRGPKLRQLKKWSADYCWSQRIARPIVAEANAAITDDARDQMTVFRNCLGELLWRTDPTRIRGMETREIVQVIDRVKPPDAESAPAVRKTYRVIDVDFAGAAS